MHFDDRHVAHKQHSGIQFGNSSCKYTLYVPPFTMIEAHLQCISYQLPLPIISNFIHALGGRSTHCAEHTH